MKLVVEMVGLEFDRTPASHNLYPLQLVIPKIEMLYILRYLEKGSGCCTPDSLLHHSLNLNFKQHKLQYIICFRMAHQ